MVSLAELQDEMVDLDTSWGSCKTNSDKLKQVFSRGSVNKIFSPTVDGINGHYYFSIDSYIIDLVIYKQILIANMLRPPTEIRRGIFDKDKYLKILDVR